MSKPNSRNQQSHGGARRDAGRPRKPVDQRRDYGVKASFTRAEYAALRREARAKGVCVSVLVARKAAHR